MSSYTDYLSVVDSYNRGELIITYYRCPIRYCNLSHKPQLTKLQLVDHLYTFHKKKTLSRVLAWFAVKRQDGSS